jgi:hypothetical protein
MLGALAMVRFGVARTADVFLAMTGDVDLAPHRYVLVRGSRTEQVFEPWRVRPALAFGFTFDVAGPALYAERKEGER